MSDDVKREVIKDTHSTLEIRKLWSKESLSVPLWKEAIARMDDCSKPPWGNVLFVARDHGSLIGLQRRHGRPRFFSGFHAIEPSRVLLMRGITFRFAFLIDPSQETLFEITPAVTEVLTIGRRERATPDQVGGQS